MKVKAISFLTLIIFIYSIFMVFTPPSLADEESIIEKMKDASDGGDSANKIVEKADEKGYYIVKTIRRIAVIAAAIFLIWTGIILWGGDSRKKAEVKDKLLWFFVSLIFIFLAEDIAATIMDFLGVELR